MKEKGFDQHVVPHKQGWAVVSGTDATPTTVFNNKAQAIYHAQQAARQQHGTLVIHNADGSVESFDSPPISPMHWGWHLSGQKPHNN